jgi:hypothetical protein
VLCALLIGGCGGSRSAKPAAALRCKEVAFVAPAGVKVGDLYGVDAASESDVWAVGNDNASGEGAGTSLVLHWNGDSWSRVKSPSPGHESTALWDVIALEPDNAWAVGTSFKGGLIEHWDGDAWRELPVSFPKMFLTGIDAVNANDIWAVGTGGSDTGHPSPVIEHWNGESWQTTVTPPAPRAYPYSLESVSAIAADDAWAVGAAITDPSSETAVPIVLHWNGTKWQLVPWPIRGDSYFRSVSAVSDRDVWAAGASGDNDAPLLAHWDGARWSAVAPKGLANTVAASRQAVWIAGANHSESFGTIARRVAGGWLPSRPARPAGGLFAAVSALPSGDAWAVGYSDADGWPIAQRACRA